MAKPRAQTIQARFGFKDNDLKTATHDTIMIWLDQNIDAVINNLLDKYPDKLAAYSKNDETSIIWERPIMTGRSGQYCVGFIDMWVRSHNFCIEVKSKIVSVGELIRQISMYKQYTRHTMNFPIFIVISPDARFEKTLESQNILFYKYTGDPLDTLMI